MNKYKQHISLEIPKRTRTLRGGNYSKYQRVHFNLAE